MIQTMNRLLQRIGTGAFHCGIEIDGWEWSYQGHLTPGETGIFYSTPRCCHGHTYSRTLLMGDTMLTKDEVFDGLKALEHEWLGNQYHTVKHNCCHFCDIFGQRLGVGGIPVWVKSLAELGAAILRARDSLNPSINEGKISWLPANCVSGQGLCPPVCYPGRSDIVTSSKVQSGSSAQYLNADDAALHEDMHEDMFSLGFLDQNALVELPIKAHK